MDSSNRIGSACHVTSCLKFHDGGERVVRVSGGDRRSYRLININSDGPELCD